MKLYQELSLLLQHLIENSGYNSLYTQQHARLNEISVKYLAPIPNLVKVSPRLDKCSKDYIVLDVEYNHHGDFSNPSVAEDKSIVEEDTWTTHRVIITPSFVSTLDISVRGPKSYRAHQKVEEYLRKQLMIESIQSQEQFDQIFGTN